MAHSLDDDGDRLAARPSNLRVASVPASHVYVRHLAPVDLERSAVRRLADPDPFVPGRSAVSQWWPPRMLDADWLERNLDTFDVFHIQFGFDAVPPRELERIARTLRSAAKPLVYTVHDLRNPHHPDRAEHDAQLDVLVAEADALVTLTAGAAEEIRSRWGREAAVVPHPHVVDFDTIKRLAARRGGTRRGDAFRVGLHVKSLRANMNPLPLVHALARAHDELSDVVIQIDGHPDVLVAGGARFDAELSSVLARYDRAGVIELRIHDYFSDEALWDYLGSLDASVLPYRFGTHSGWLEACRDLGTDVIAPTCGYYGDQGPVRLYRNDDTGFDADSLVAAVAQSRTSPTPSPLSVAFRREQRDDIARRHETMYARVM